VLLGTDGDHTVVAHAVDGASPPNAAEQTVTLSIDRTPPELVLSAQNATSRGGPMALHAEAHDPRPGSGLDAYRLRVAGGAWSAWSTQAPTEATLPTQEGEAWIDAQSRDRAGNIQQASANIVIDHTPPEVLAARWVGWATSSGSAPKPTVFVAARDPLAGAGPGSGVQAVRFAPGEDGPWSAWTATNGSAAFAIAFDASHGIVLELRDRAWNAGSIHAIGAPPAYVPPTTPVAGAASAANSASNTGASVLVQPSVLPAQGVAASPFTFSVVVHLLDGRSATKVEVEIDGARHALAPTGPVLSDGSQVFTGEFLLPATGLDQAHSYRFVATYDGNEVATPWTEGPDVTVLQVGSAGAPHQSTPAPAAGLAIVLLAALARRRRA
jgi:MYXO-CTERM domain-containing protein